MDDDMLAASSAVLRTSAIMMAMGAGVELAAAAGARPNTRY
jgi:hypothetical protein